jgi:hypothetical protein
LKKFKNKMKQSTSFEVFGTPDELKTQKKE